MTHWQGAYVARALNYVSILNVGPERAKPNKCQSATLQRNSTTSVVFTGFHSARSRALLCTLSRSALHWYAISVSGAPRTERTVVWAYQFIIAHFIFIFNLCGKIHSRFVVRVRLLPVFVNIVSLLISDWLSSRFFLRAYRAFTENSQSRWRKQHASRGNRST